MIWGTASILAVLLTNQGLSMMPEKVVTTADLQKLFTVTPDQLAARAQEATDRAEQELSKLLAIPRHERTFANTVAAYDALDSYLGPIGGLAQALMMVSPDAALRKAASEIQLQLEKFTIDKLHQNPAVYKMLVDYVEGVGRTESISAEGNHFLNCVLKDFQRLGINLPPEQFAEVKKIRQELAELSIAFEAAISEDTRSITVDRPALEGLTDTQVAPYLQEGGNYKLGVDYPTYSLVMENCSSETTRKALWEAFSNRAYPQNDATLRKVIALRDRLAQLTGFSSFAAFAFDDMMAKSVERVDAFLTNIEQRITKKVQEENALLKAHLPEGVTLSSTGLFKPWDYAYIESTYKKKHLAVDEQLIAEYFPLETTLQRLLEIYEQFLGLRFTTVHVAGLWHPEVRVVAAYLQDTLLGYLLLDLHPRPGKFTHACELGIFKAHAGNEGKAAAVCLVIANFPQGTAEKPALLLRNDVITFFHEFGHAIHDLLGATELYSFGGTSVRRDFVEMPSQMLEEWMWDPAILKQVSSHYKTGEPLPDALIERIRGLKKFNAGNWVQRQAALSRLSLACFLEGADKNPTQLKREIFAKVRPSVLQHESDHFEAAFGHLMGYNAAYYSYLYAKYFALAMFAAIKKEGLLNPVVGERYRNLILKPGGSQEPDAMLRSFLGKDPDGEAFFADLGL